MCISGIWAEGDIVLSGGVAVYEDIVTSKGVGGTLGLSLDSWTFYARFDHSQAYYAVRYEEKPSERFRYRFDGIVSSATGVSASLSSGWDWDIKWFSISFRLGVQVNSRWMPGTRAPVFHVNPYFTLDLEARPAEGLVLGVFCGLDDLEHYFWQMSPLFGARGSWMFSERLGLGVSAMYGMSALWYEHFYFTFARYRLECRVIL